MTNLFPVESKVTTARREELLGQKSLVIWFTGLSGSGKSTLAIQLEAHLSAAGFKTFLLDGDNIRTGLNKDLTFSGPDRVENIRRIGEVCKLFSDAGLIVLSAFISPFQSDREQVKQIVGSEKYFEVFVDTPLEICEQRDVKGLYSKARRGELKEFTGIDSPYEKPENPDMHIRTAETSIPDAVSQLINAIKSNIALAAK